MGEKAAERDGPLYKLSQQAFKDGENWFPEVSHDLPHLVLGMCGEAGEANLVKKLQRGDLTLKDADTRYRVMMETTDVLTYLLNIAGLIGLDLDQSLQHVRSENIKRFANGKAVKHVRS